MDAVEGSFHKLIDLEPRLRQTASAFFILFNDPTIEKDFIGFMKDYNQEIINERADSLEGKILNTICELMNVLEEVTSTDVTNEINKDLTDKTKFRASTIGKIIKSLGFEVLIRKVAGKSKRTIQIDRKNLKILKNRYGVEIKEENQQQALNSGLQMDDTYF